MYEELKYIVESDLDANEAYYISEEKRDLTLLPQFQEPNISDTVYLEIMLANYKMVVEEASIIDSNLSTPTKENTKTR